MLLVRPEFHSQYLSMSRACTHPVNGRDAREKAMHWIFEKHKFFQIDLQKTKDYLASQLYSPVTDQYRVIKDYEKSTMISEFQELFDLSNSIQEVAQEILCVNDARIPVSKKSKHQYNYLLSSFYRYREIFNNRVCSLYQNANKPILSLESYYENRGVDSELYRVDYFLTTMSYSLSFLCSSMLGLENDE